LKSGGYFFWIFPIIRRNRVLSEAICERQREHKKGLQEMIAHYAILSNTKNKTLNKAVSGIMGELL